MFQTVCIRTQRHDSVTDPLDIGSLAEAMVYYGHVRVVATIGELRQLVRVFTPDLLVDFLNRGYLRISYWNGGASIMTENTGAPNALHRPVFYSLPRWNAHDVCVEACQEVSGVSRGRRQGVRLAQRLHEVKPPDEIRQGFTTDLPNSQLLRDAALAMIAVMAPTYEIPANLQLETELVRTDERGPWYRIHSNIDFAQLNRCHEDFYQHEGDYSAAHLLTWIFAAQADVYFAALYSGDLLTSPLGSSIIALKFRQLLAVTQYSLKNIEALQKETLGEGAAVREAINTGERTLRDLLDVLDESARFKTWLAEREPDASLLAEYIREIQRVQWISTLPAKTLRWLLSGVGATIAGLALDPAVGAGVGLGLSATDQFVTERLFGGWRPSQFVENALQPFVERG